MSDLNFTSTNSQPPSSGLDTTLQAIDEMMHQFWNDYPELYNAVQETKQAKANRLARLKASMAATHASQSDAERIPIVNMPLRGERLRQKRYDSHCQLRQKIHETGAQIIHRTQAQNKKCAHQTIEEAQAFRGELVADQLRTWRSMLPGVLNDF
ncbi:MAG: hypothetical protein GY821_07380, partial [Gammaproteobacteria bacterium]|nr:hypothetical protein [Gammaproteobacteria bacterium]